MFNVIDNIKLKRRIFFFIEKYSDIVNFTGEKKKT